MDPSAQITSVMPRAKDFADMLEHLDVYAIGEGRLQREEIPQEKLVDSPLEGPRVSFENPLDARAEVTVHLAGMGMRLHGTEAEVVELARVLDKVWNDRCAKG